MKKGDIACFAHASTVASERAVIGGLEVLCDPKPDPTQFDVESPYFDPAAAKSGKAKWMCVEVKMVTEMAIPVPIAELESKSGGARDCGCRTSSPARLWLCGISWLCEAARADPYSPCVCNKWLQYEASQLCRSGVCPS